MKVHITPTEAVVVMAGPTEGTVDYTQMSLSAVSEYVNNHAALTEVELSCLERWLSKEPRAGESLTVEDIDDETVAVVVLV